MIQYKLIKEYPGSEKLGAIHWFQTDELGPSSNSIWKGTNFYNSHPQFWEKVEELDYKILTVNPSKENTTNTNKEATITWKVCNKDLRYWDIHSVKRLSDGEVFTIGDEVLCGGNKISEIYITKIKSDSQGIWIKHKYGDVHLNFPPKLKTPLFTTEDGVEIFEGNEYWYVVTFDHNIGHEWKPFNHVADWNGNAELMKPPLGGKQFSTKVKAFEYVLHNKPCLSISEIGSNIPEGTLLRLLETVNSKL